MLTKNARPQAENQAGLTRDPRETKFGKIVMGGGNPGKTKSRGVGQARKKDKKEGQKLSGSQ